MKKSGLASVPRRIAITGVGMVTPLGLTRDLTWEGLVAGKRAVSWLDAEARSPANFKCHQGYFGACVPGDHANDRTSAFALRAAIEAVEQADLSPCELQQAACVIGTSKIELQLFDNWKLRCGNEVAAACCGDVSILYPSTPAQIVGVHLGCEAVILCPVAACATGLVSVIRAANLIREGISPLAIAGSTDSSLHPGLLASYRRLGVLATPGDDPAAACRPFDADRSGFAVGEGAGIIVLEDWEHATSRGATILAEWVEGVIGSDPTGLTSIDGGGLALAESVGRLLRNSGLSPTQIDCVNLHGTATKMNDEAENAALQRIFCGSSEPVQAFGIKGAIGHLMGAAGAVEIAACVMAIAKGVIPLTTNLQTPGFKTPPVQYLRHDSLQTQVRHLLKVSLGFGGTVAAGLLRSFQEEKTWR